LCLPEVPQSWQFFQPLPTSFSSLTRKVPSQSFSTLLRACNSGFGASLNEPVPAIHAVRRIGVHARRSHQHRRRSAFDSLISLPAFLLTRPPTSHNKESFVYWGVPGRALRQVKLVVRNVAAGLLCLPTGAGQAAWVHIRGGEREGGDPGRDHDHIGMGKDSCAYAQKRVLSSRRAQFSKLARWWRGSVRACLWFNAPPPLMDGDERTSRLSRLSRTWIMCGQRWSSR
jgi:hypothetical protein